MSAQHCNVMTFNTDDLPNCLPQQKYTLLNAEMSLPYPQTKSTLYTICTIIFGPLDDDKTDLCNADKCRVEKLWKQEIRRVGMRNASMSRVVFRFLRSRFLVATFAMLCYVGLNLCVLVSLFLSSHYFFTESRYSCNKSLI